MGRARISAVIAVLLWLALMPCSQEPAEVPTPAQVEETKLALDEAYRSGDTKRIQTALEAAQAVPDPAVVKRVARALRDERREVRLSALQALRWIEREEALDVLHDVLRERRWSADRELMFATLRGVGQHADSRSVSDLAREPFEPHDHGCWRARIFGLARIRTRPALEALFTILGATTSGSGGRRVAPVMPDVRTALILLTGVDQGLAPESWEHWWRDNKRSFQLPAELPLLPKELRQEWDGFWGLSQTYTRERRREDRGQ
jgi:hypothetical protein